jgi:hypothetical protein
MSDEPRYEECTTRELALLVKHGKTEEIRAAAERALSEREQATTSAAD